MSVYDWEKNTNFFTVCIAQLRFEGSGSKMIRKCRPIVVVSWYVGSLGTGGLGVVLRAGAGKRWLAEG